MTFLEFLFSFVVLIGQFPSPSLGLGQDLGDSSPIASISKRNEIVISPVGCAEPRPSFFLEGVSIGNFTENKEPDSNGWGSEDLHNILLRHESSFRCVVVEGFRSASHLTSRRDVMFAWANTCQVRKWCICGKWVVEKFNYGQRLNIMCGRETIILKDVLNSKPTSWSNRNNAGTITRDIGSQLSFGS